MSHPENMATGSEASMPLDTQSLFSKDVRDRFWAKVDKRGPEQCWEWRGTRTEHGYGQFAVDGRVHIASRLIASASLGRPLRGGHSAFSEYACHKCDNPPCVNPGHIFVGTPRDNAWDMLRKGRNGRGEKTRIGRIRAAHARQLTRLVEGSIFFSRDGFMSGPLDMIENVVVACDVVPNDVELEPAPDTDELLDMVRARRALDQAIADLPSFKMRAAMHLRRQGLTLEDAGRRLGVTREYIRQLEEKAIPKLQKHPALAVLIRGKPFPKPVTRHAISNERAREINEKCAAFFGKRKATTPIVKARRGRPPGSKDSRPRRRPLTGCVYCQATDHVVRDCLKRWRDERHKEAA